MRTLVGRAARLAGGGDRPHRERGGLAPAGAAAGGAADRSGGDRRAARRGRGFRRRPGAARRRARRASRPRPTSPARSRAWWSARGGPRDLAAIRDGLVVAAELARTPRRVSTPRPPRSPRPRPRCGAPDPAIAAELAAALADELPAFRRDGGFVRAGYDAALDETRALRDESRRVVAALQARYADETQVRALKIRHNNVLGYFVEVTAQHGDKLHEAAAQRDLHPSPDAGRPGALHHHRARRPRGQDRQRGRSRARARARDLRAARRAGGGGGRRHQGGRPGARRDSTSPPRSRCSRSSATMCGREVDAGSISRSRAGAIRWSSRRSPTAPFVANDCDLSAAAGRERRPHLRGHRPQHGAANRPICARTR